MIADILIPALRVAFPGREFRVGRPPQPIVVFPCSHEAIGDVSIWDDGTEATVGVGQITHGHFDAYDSALFQAEVERRIVNEVVEFLAELFADQVLLWQNRDARSAGWHPFVHRPGPGEGRGELEEALARLSADDVTYLWSGPIPNPKKGAANVRIEPTRR